MNVLDRRRWRRDLGLDLVHALEVGRRVRSGRSRRPVLYGEATVTRKEPA